MTECINTIRPSVDYGEPGKEGACARIAVEFRTGLTADCTSLEIDGRWKSHADKAGIWWQYYGRDPYKDRRPQLATVRPGVMPKRPGIPGKHTVFI